MGHQTLLSVVEIGLIDLPTERYKRNVVRGKLDLVGEFIECFLVFPIKMLLFIS